MKPHTVGGRACVSCGHRVEAVYCSNCGEKRLTDHDRSLWHLVSEGLELFGHFDSKILRTVGLLVRRPGFLTTEYWMGRRVRYVKPLQLLVLLNVVYFACTWASHELGFNARVMFPSLNDILNDRVFSGWAVRVVRAHLLATGANQQEYALAFNTELEHLAKSLFILLVPILAVFLRAFYPRGRWFVDQLIAATHLVSFYILFWSVFLVVLAVGAKAVNVLDAIRLAPPVLIATYIGIAFRVMYRESWLLTIAKALVFLFLVVEAITNLYDFVLFWLAYALV